MQQSNLNLDESKGFYYRKPQLTDEERDYFKAGIGYFVNDPNFTDSDNMKAKFVSGNYDDEWLQEQYNQVFYTLEEIREFSQEMIDTGLFYAIDYQGNKVILTKKLGVQPGQNVFEGLLIRKNNNNLEVVLKWTDAEDDAVGNEIQNWADFIATYTSKGQVPDTPYIDDNFYMFGYQVMVIEKLEPLTEAVKDDLANFTAQILDQLQHLHEFACHSDIKPDNILKRIGQEKYFIIDLGGISRKPLGYGYARAAYTPNFTSQLNFFRTIITPKYDLLELGFVLSYFTTELTSLTLMMFEQRKETDPNYWRYILPTNKNVDIYLRTISNIVENGVTSRTYELLNIIMNVPPRLQANNYLARTNPQVYQELRNLGAVI